MVSPPDNHQKYRFQLVAFALFTILISIVGVGIILLLLDFDASDFRKLVSTEMFHDTASGMAIQKDDSYHRHQLDLAMIAQSEKRELREFFLKICQTVLLNLLLPMLTAMLAFKLRGSNND